MTGRTTKVVAVRLSPADADRLGAHGSTGGNAVRRLLDLADEHETCGAPMPKRRVSKTTTVSTRQQPAASTRQQPTTTTYRVDRAGRPPYLTNDRAKAEKVAAREGASIRTIP